MLSEENRRYPFDDVELQAYINIALIGLAYIFELPATKGDTLTKPKSTSV